MNLKKEAMNSNSLATQARKLAERLEKEMWDTETRNDSVDCADVVIREAMQAALDEASETVITAWSTHGCDDFIIRSDAAAAIESLKSEIGVTK